MHVGAVIAVRQFVGQYMITAKPWQRVLIGVGVAGGALLMVATGVVFGHFMMAATGVLLLLVTGNIWVAILRARRARSRGTEPNVLYLWGVRQLR